MSCLVHEVVTEKKKAWNMFTISASPKIIFGKIRWCPISLSLWWLNDQLGDLIVRWCGMQATYEWLLVSSDHDNVLFYLSNSYSVFCFGCAIKDLSHDTILCDLIRIWKRLKCFVTINTPEYEGSSVKLFAKLKILSAHQKAESENAISIRITFTQKQSKIRPICW